MDKFSLKICELIVSYIDLTDTKTMYSLPDNVDPRYDELNNLRELKSIYR